jgi:hypothetical protein
VKSKRRGRSGGKKNNRLLRLLLPILCVLILPVLLSLLIHLPVLFGRYSSFTPEMSWLAGGAALFLIVFFTCGAPVRSYILEHELSHILFALMTGVRIRRISLRSRSSYVQTDRVNLLIALAPYTFPLYTVILALTYRIFLSPLAYRPVTLVVYFLFGLTLSFHIVATVHYLQLEQPDLKRYGYFSSLIIILVLSLAVLVLLSALLFEKVEIIRYFRVSMADSGRIYSRIGEVFRWTISRLASS